MSDTLDLFKTTFIMMAFYSFAITILAYAMPGTTSGFVSEFQTSGSYNFNNMSQTIEGAYSKQSTIPVIEIGALVFYSGNILIDLLVNFAFAIPQMIGLIIHGIMALINVNSYFWAYTEVLATTIMVGMWIFGLIELLTNIRSGHLI